MKPANIPSQPSELPLSSLQKEIWVNQMLHPNVPMFNVGGYACINGNLDVPLFEQALAHVLNMHEALRIRLHAGHGLPQQSVTTQPDPGLQVMDFSGREQEAKAWIQQQHSQAFPLYETSLCRFALCKIADDHYYWYMQYHYLIADGKTLALVIQDVAASYNALLNAATLPTAPAAGYGAYVATDQAYMGSAPCDEDRRYWQAKYQDLPSPLLYPQHADDFTPGETVSSERISLELPHKLFVQLDHFAATQKLPVGNILLGLLYTYFARLNQQDDLVIGMISLLHREAGSQTPDFGRTAGFFLNVVPVRCHFDPQNSFSGLLQALQAQWQKDLAHARLPLGEINRLARVNRDSRQRSQLFELELAYIDFDCDVSLGESPLWFNFLTHGYEQYALTVYVERFHAAGNVAVHFDYNRAWFKQPEVALLAERFTYLLQQVIQSPDTPVSELVLMPDAERTQLLQAFNATARAYPTGQCIHQLFEAQAAQTPEAIAAVFAGKTLSYAELNRRANQLAHYLLSAGVQPDTLIGVCVERSLEMLVSLLGVLKAGGAYVPLDPAYPQDRLAFMLEDSRVPVLLTQERWLASLPTPARTLCLDRDWAQVSPYAQDNPRAVVHPRHLAYVIYTSGSTGRPKGVMLEHQGLCNLALDHARCYDIHSGSRVLQFVSLNFDVATADIFMTLCAGATLYLPPAADQALANGLVQILREQAITHCQLPAAVLASLPTDIELPDLQVIVSGGEAPAASMVKHWSRGRRYFNVYGPTETTVCATMHECSDDTAKLPIGQPIANTQVYVLDGKRQPAPIGMAGELYIGGAGVARGYLNRPELTAERFVPHPFSANSQARLYKTGDLVRYQPDGKLEFLGRIDQQIKLRGFRIELEEIEHAISQHPTIKDNVVVLHESATHGKRLVAYVILQSEGEFQRSALQTYLKAKLPEYMQPASWVILESMPLTPNGKVDRKALAQREVDYPTSADFSEPRTDAERQLLTCWQMVLGLEHIGIHHNFFELGGDSLSGMQLVTQLQETFGQVFQLADVFRYPTIAEFSERLQHTTKTLDEHAIHPANNHQSVPLSFSQEEVWWHVRQSPGDTSFNICNAFRLQGALRQDILTQSLNAIMQRHSLLRTRFHEQAGQPVQSVMTGVQPVFIIEDISTLNTRQQQEEVARQLTAEENQPFDLQQAPLWRTRLLHLGTEQHVLIVCFHHIIEDAWSIQILLQELAALYSAFASGQASPLQPLTIQYADFALWQRQHYTPDVLQNRHQYWQTLLQDKPAHLRLPDKPCTLVESRKTYQSGMEGFTLLPATITPLRTLGQQQGASLSVVLLAAYVTLLHQVSGQYDLVIGMPMSKRNHHQVEPLMGYFSGMSVLRVQLPAVANFVSILARVGEAMQQTMQNQDLTLKQVWNSLQLPWSGEQQLLFRTVFNFIPVPRKTLRMADVTVEPMALKREKMVRDLVIGLWDKDGTGAAFEGFFRYRQDLFEPATIQHLVRQFKDLLDKVAKHPEQPVIEFLVTPPCEPARKRVVL